MNGRPRALLSHKQPAALTLALIGALITSANAAPPTITVEQAHAAAEEIARLIENRYVFPDKRQTIADAVRRARTDHWYDVEDPYLFADRITTHLRAVGN